MTNKTHSPIDIEDDCASSTQIPPHARQQTDLLASLVRDCFRFLDRRCH